MKNFFPEVGNSSIQWAIVIIPCWQTHKTHKKSGWKLPIYKVCCTQWTNTSANDGFIRKKHLLFFPTRTLLYLVRMSCSTAKSSAGTGCLQELETHTKHVLLCREACFAMKIPSFNKQGKATHSELGRSSPDGKLTKQSKQETGSLILTKCILLSEWTPGPMVVFFGKQRLLFPQISLFLLCANISIGC